jgi:hypothetical protein
LVNARISHTISPRSLYSVSFPIHYTLNILPRNAIYSELLTVINTRK